MQGSKQKSAEVNYLKISLTKFGEMRFTAFFFDKSYKPKIDLIVETKILAFLIDCSANGRLAFAFIL